jgi:hypothetical protein
VYFYKSALLSLHLPLQARMSLVSPRRCAGRPRRAPRHQSPAGVSRTFVPCGRATHNRMHRRIADFHMFLHDALFAISVGCSESRGHWQGGSKKAILLQVLRLAAVSLAYSWSSARCLAAPGTSPICEQAGNADSTVSERIAIGPIVCIVTSTDWYASSGTNSVIVDRLLSLLRAHQNCDGSGRFCQKMVATRFCQIRNLTRAHRCGRLAPAPDSRWLQARHALLQSKRDKPAQKWGIIPTPAKWAGVALPTPTSLYRTAFDRDGAALATRVGLSALQGLLLLCPRSLRPPWLDPFIIYNDTIEQMPHGNEYSRQIAARYYANRGLMQIENKDLFVLGSAAE